MPLGDGDENGPELLRGGEGGRRGEVGGGEVREQDGGVRCEVRERGGEAGLGEDGEEGARCEGVQDEARVSCGPSCCCVSAFFAVGEGGDGAADLPPRARTMASISVKNRVVSAIDERSDRSVSAESMMTLSGPAGAVTTQQCMSCEYVVRTEGGSGRTRTDGLKHLALERRGPIFVCARGFFIARDVRCPVQHANATKLLHARGMWQETGRRIQEAEQHRGDFTARALGIPLYQLAENRHA